jgi:hypothetical protein
MKVLRYLIFLSILSGTFFVIYRQSDDKGFRRWWISFKMAVIIAASTAGLGSESVEPKEFSGFEGTDQQVILVGRNGSGIPSNVPSNIGQQGQSPSNFPTPPSGGPPSCTVPGVNPYRTAPGVDQGLGAAANPAGAGGGGIPEFDNTSPALQKLDKINSEHSSFYSDKKNQQINVNQKKKLIQ